MLKKEFSSFDVTAVVRELRERILNSRVSNIYQPNQKTVLLKLHRTDESDLRLILESSRRLHLTSYDLEKPSTPPSFCMALRKYLRNCWILSIEQHEFERVVVFGFRTKSGNLRLILELFGDGNIILVDQDNRISQALTYKRMRDRQVIRGETFSFAPSAGRNPLEISEEDLKTRLSDAGSTEVVRALARSLSIGGNYSEEVLFRAGVKKDKPCSELNENETAELFHSLRELLTQVTEGPLQPRIVLDASGGFADVVPIVLKRYEGVEFLPYRSFNEALDDFYARIIAVEEIIDNVHVDELKREAERLKRMIAEQEEVLRDTEGKAENERKIGDAIYAHFNDLQAIMDRFLMARQNGKGWESIIQEVKQNKKVMFESFESKSQIIRLSVNGLMFGLDLKRTLFENASEHYEQGKKAKQKLVSIREALEDSRKRLAEAEKKVEATEIPERTRNVEALQKIAERKVKQKEWYEKFRWFNTSDGFLVVAGKDAVTNEVLVKKHVERDDVVFHADIVGAPFVIVKTGGKKPSEQALREAGQFAAAYSRGWREGFGSVDVYSVRPEQLSKSGPSGESVAHGAFFVGGQRNWQRGVALKLAIGVVIENDELRFVGGPVDAVRAKTQSIVVIVPGQESGKEIAKNVLVALAAKVSKEFRDKVLKSSVEQVREFIPYGKGRVLEG